MILQSYWFLRAEFEFHLTKLLPFLEIVHVLQVIIYQFTSNRSKDKMSNIVLLMFNFLDYPYQ